MKIRVERIGLNYAEIQSRKGLYGWAPKLPYILGMEAYGEIIETSPEITENRIGEKVIVGTQYGSYAEIITVSQQQALPILPDFSPDENAAFAVNYLTAWVALMKMARLQPTDRVLIQAAGGGVGTAAVQIAKAYGCTVYGTASSDDKIELMRSLDVDIPINYKTDDFAEVIRNTTDGAGVDVVLEVVGGEVFRKSRRLLNPFGRIVVAGFAMLNLNKWNPLSWWNTWKAIPKASVSSLGESSTGLMATHLGYLLKDPKLMATTWSELTQFVKTHSFKPIVGHTFTFEDLPKAHRLMESRKSHGKIVITLN